MVALIDLLTSHAKAGDETELLLRFLVPMQEQFDDWTAQIRALQNAISPFLAPKIETLQEGQGWTTLDLYLWQVGLTDELETVTATLSDEQKRILRRAVAPLWKKRGLPQGWLRWVSILTGNPALYIDYFDTRYVSDEDFLGDGPAWTDPVDDPIFGAYHSDLYVLDPGTVMRAVIKELVDRTRPSSERVTIRWVDALERWDRDFSGWARTGTVYADEAPQNPKAIAAPGGTALYTLFPVAAQDYVARFDFTPGAGTIADFVTNAIDDQTFIFARIDMVAQAVSIYVNASGVPTLKATAAFPVTVEPDVQYRLELSTARIGPNSMAVDVWLDGESFLRTSFLGFSSGNFGWRNHSTSTDDLEMSTVMAFFRPLEYSFAAPPGAYEP